MTTITLETLIQAPIERCFDISRNIEVHMLSTAATKERAISGRTTGLCELGDTITWEAIHFGIKQQLTVQILELHFPNYFVDQQLRGSFKSMRHDHLFSSHKEGYTLMKDVFTYEVPYGVIGSLFDLLVLKRYMLHFLKTRNRTIKSIAESSATV